MRVALLTVTSHDGCTLKDVAGGYGTVFEVGTGWRAKLLERAKSHVASLPPLVFGYLSAQLRSEGHSVSVANVHWPDTPWLPTEPGPGADVVVLLSSIVDAEAEVEVLRALRRTRAKTIVVGAYATQRPDPYLEVADAVVLGEPEALGASVLEAVGRVSAGQVDDLDRLPFPDWTPFDVDSYRYAFLSLRHPTLPVGSARGCAYGCGYCPWRVTAQFRERDPDAVGREVAQLRDRFGARAVAFRDPLFNLDPDRVRALARALQPLDVRFSAEMRADRLDASLLALLYDAGLRSLEIGVESVNRDMLRAEKRRPPNSAQIEDTVRTAQKLGIRVICNYVLGLPDDDEATIRKTVAWAKELDSFAVQFTVATPYPGTSLEPMAAPRMLPMAKMTGFSPTFEHPRIRPNQLRALREWAYVSYHFRPRYAWRFARHATAALLDDLRPR
ncbi:MAG: radical SAM protein [Sandaracinaceae bacterium]